MDPPTQSAYITLGILRLAFLVVCDAAFVSACKPPHRAEQSEIRKDKQRTLDWTISSIPLLAAPFIYSLTLLRMWHEYPLASEPALGSETDRWFDMVELIGALGMLLGGQLRSWCYRVLGRFFTFNLAIRKDHQLVTSGPYALVRHPSYTGILMMINGLSARYTASNSFLHDYLPWYLITWIRWSSFIAPTYVIVRRIGEEEAMLEHEFGNQWTEYRRRTWRLIPLVW